MQRYGYTLADLENMVPWERDVYIALLIDHLREKEEKRRAAQKQAQFK
jgi:hypothetical protein